VGTERSQRRKQGEKGIETVMEMGDKRDTGIQMQTRTKRVQEKGGGGDGGKVDTEKETRI
jgi:hypothetical protein